MDEEGREQSLLLVELCQDKESHKLHQDGSATLLLEYFPRLHEMEQRREVEGNGSIYETAQLGGVLRVEGISEDLLAGEEENGVILLERHHARPVGRLGEGG